MGLKSSKRYQFAHRHGIVVRAMGTRDCGESETQQFESRARIQTRQ